jgi:Protein of unknown function (DUF4058)/23S rRNA-intervening sequence protein
MLIRSAKELEVYRTAYDLAMMIFRLNKRFPAEERYALVPALTPGSAATATTNPVLPAPAQVGVPAVDTETLSFLEIHDGDGNELVTVIELLSPSNKYVGPGREQYLAKARQLQRSWVHFVEIDLLRGGPRMPWLDMPECEYCVVVSRFEERPKAGFWPIRLCDRLPEIPIPLRRGDADARLDLQQVLHHIYDAAGYGYYIYKGAPEPPLPAADAACAAAFLPAASTPNEP